MTEWIKEHPEPPTSSESDWYWFKFDSELDICVMEIWPERKYWPSGEWGPRVPPPKKRPSKKRKTKI